MDACTLPVPTSPVFGFRIKILAKIHEIPINVPIIKNVFSIPTPESKLLETGAMKNPNRPFAVTITPDENPVLPGNHFCTQARWLEQLSTSLN